MRTKIQTAALIILLMANSAGASQENPYLILKSHFEAIGGVQAVKEQNNIVMEGEIDFQGMKGNAKYVLSGKENSYFDFNLKVFRQVDARNAESSWTMDANDKVTMNLEETILERERLSSMMLDLEHLDPNSEIFKVEYAGVETSQNQSLDKIRITNSMNSDSIVQFFDRTTHMLVKEISESGQDTQITQFSEFKNVGGVIHAFRWDIETKPINNPHSIQWSQITTPERLDMSIFAPPSQDTDDFEFTTNADSVEVPFRYIGRHIYLTARIGESTDTWLLDSGAQMSCIEPEFAKRTNLEVIGKMKIGGAGEEVDAAFVAVPELYLSQLKLKDQKVLALSIANLVKKKAGVQIAGILGFDFLSRFVTKIDYQNQRITFYKSDLFQYAGTGDVLDAPLKNGTFTVPMHVDNKYSGKFRIDLGAGGLAFHYPFAHQNAMHGRKCIELLSTGAGGQTVSLFSKFDQLKIGTYELNNPIFSFPKAEVKGSFGGVDIIGNIGNALLENFTIILDYERQQLILEKNPLATAPFSFDRSGLQLLLNDAENVEIFHITKGSPAERAGLNVGDILTHINGIECSNFKGLYTIANLFKAEAGTEYKLSIIRNGKSEHKKIKLKELL